MTATPLPFSIPEISDHEFGLFQSLIRRQAGIHLAETKKQMLVCRLMRRLSALKLSTFEEYYRQVVYGGSEEMARLLDAICTNETWFFRNAGHFAFVKEDLVPRWIADQREGRRARRVAAWSAACSTGEEPFSLAMVLLDALPDWTLTLQATDLSSRVLERARQATWPVEKSQDIGPGYLKRYMLRGMGAQHGNMKAGPELQSAVSFSRMNLNDEIWSMEAAGPFDLIFCRNVLMYFDANCRTKIVQRLLTRLAPRGYLFVGDAEGLGVFDELRMVAPAIYTPRSNPNQHPVRRDGGDR